jgi:hypothetical protein
LTGDNPRDGAGPQPGGPGPAPGELALVQAFLNTHCDLAFGGGETLASPEALRWSGGTRGCAIMLIAVPRSEEQS